jgi:signal transduction histidine kinase
MKTLRFNLHHGGELVVHSRTYSDLFGSDKIELIQNFVDLADLAFARCEATVREREFISNAAHELRTPLTTMTGVAAMLAVDRDRMTEEQITKCIDGMVRQGNRVRELVNALLDLAQIERGTIAFADEPIDIASIVDNAIDFTPAPSGRHVAVDIDPAVRVRGDPERLQQVFVNLITNAYRYGGDEIHIRSGHMNGRVSLHVDDNGPGVPADVVSTIFEPFARGTDATVSGSGLGLAICRRIVEGLGGAIFYDDSPDGGARFTVELRRAA